MQQLKKKIRHVPDFPKTGILFYDITTLLKDPQGFKDTVDGLTEPFRKQDIDVVVGIESRGFILGAPMADRLGVGFVPVRKPGKLPASTIVQNYELEYGSDSLEIHEDAIASGQRVLIVDDLLATGGTACAAKDLVIQAGGNVVGMGFLIELEFLDGRKRLGDTPLFVALKYQS